MKLNRFAVLCVTALLSAFPLVGCQPSEPTPETGNEQPQQLSPEALAMFAEQNGVSAGDLGAGEMVLTSTDGTAETMRWTPSGKPAGPSQQGVCQDCCTTGYCCQYVSGCTYYPSTGEIWCTCSIWGCCNNPV